MHHLRSAPHPVLPGEYKLTSADADELASHIRECYPEEHIAACELASYAHRDAHDEELRIAICDRATGRIVASGIGEYGVRIGKGILDWIQVSPDHRHRGLGRAVVCKMIRQLSKKAGFATVSGRLNNPDILMPYIAPAVLSTLCYGMLLLAHYDLRIVQANDERPRT